MNTYKITNITNLAHKRDTKYNSPINIEYIDNRVKKVATVKPGDSMFLIVQNLPLAVHRLRIKNLVAVSEVSPAELSKKVKAAKPKKVAKKNPIKDFKPKVKKEPVSVDIPAPEKKTTTRKKAMVK